MRFIILLIALFFPALAVANCGVVNLIDELGAEERAALDAAVAAHPYPEGNVWHAEKGNSRIHVIGTFHMPDPRFYEMMQSLTPIIQNADMIFAESSDTDLAALEQKIISDPSLAFIATGPTLIDYLGEEDWPAFQTAMQSRGIPGVLAAKMQPWYAMVTLSLPPCALLSAVGGGGLDQQIMAAGRDAGIAITGLESPEEALNALKNDDIEQQISMLRLALAAEGESAALYSTMATAYFAGQHRALWEFNRMSMMEFEGDDSVDVNATLQVMERDLLTMRNRNWMEVLLPATTEGDFIVAVGAGHLSGVDGVLQLLENAGYSLSRVDF